MVRLPSIRDFVSSICNPAMIKAGALQGGQPCCNTKGDVLRYAGGFCVVFAYNCQHDKYAVRCWHTLVEDAEKRLTAISNELNRINLPYFVDFQYVGEGICTPLGVQPITVMKWVDAESIKDYIERNLQDAKTVDDLAESFKRMVQDLHRHNISHGDLQHGNIMVKKDGQIVLVDYDSMYVPALDGMTDEIKGLPVYQHKSRYDNTRLTPKADYFSELVIYTSIKALARYPELWNKYRVKSREELLFSLDDMQSPNSSKLFEELRNCGDNELKDTVGKLEEFIKRPSIDELEPLEKVIVDHIAAISNKWKKNRPNSQRKRQLPDVQQVVQKWKRGR